MPTQILMPALSPTMEEGKLAKWVKSEGDEVRSGDVIAEIETDKATMEIEAVDEGRLGRILVPAGTEGVKVNTPIAVILTDGEDASALANGYAGKAPSPGHNEQSGRPFSPRGDGQDEGALTVRSALRSRASGLPPRRSRAWPLPKAWNGAAAKEAPWFRIAGRRRRACARSSSSARLPRPKRRPARGNARLLP